MALSRSDPEEFERLTIGTQSKDNDPSNEEDRLEIEESIERRD